jgi:MRG-binding protein
MHKHFRMIAIHNYMLGQGVISPGDEHTTISGLWIKLGSLYNLPVLDEREDAVFAHDSPSTSAADNVEEKKGKKDTGRVGSSVTEKKQKQQTFAPFDLPEHEYGTMKFARRINLAGTESPAAMEFADSDDAASSPARAAASGRPDGRRVSRRTGRGSSKVRQRASTGGEGRGRRASKAVSTAEDDSMVSETREGEDAAVVKEDEEDQGEAGGSDQADEDDEVDDLPRARKSARTRGTADRGRGGSRGRTGTRSRGRRR